MDEGIAKHHRSVLQSLESEASRFRQWTATDLASRMDGGAGPRMATGAWEETTSSDDGGALGEEPPSLHRVGLLKMHYGTSVLEAPALIPVLGGHHVAVLFDGASGGPARASASRALDTLALRLAASTQPGGVVFTVYDPLGLGKSFPCVLRLPEDMRGQMLWSRRADMARGLEALRSHSEKVLQQLLSRGAKDIAAFNRRDDTISEAYRVLVIANFPSEFDGGMCETLVKLLENGRESGVSCVLSIDETALRTAKGGLTESYAPIMQRLERNGTMLRVDGHGATMAPLDPSIFGVERGNVGAASRVAVFLDAVPEEGVLARIADSIGQGADRAPVQRIGLGGLLKNTKLWSGVVDKDGGGTKLRAPVGLRGSETQFLEVQGNGGHHALIGGATGAGKTVLLHTIILSFAHTYSPRDLLLYLLDFKEGVEFKPYEHLPHARVVLTRGTQQYGLEVLRMLTAEIVTRSELFKEAGVHDIHQYRSRPQDPRKTHAEVMPFLFLVADEFHRLFERSSGNTEAGLLLERLVREGRAFGIHVFLASQVPPESFRNGIESQLGIRIALRMSPEGLKQIIPDSEGVVAQLVKPGQAVFNGSGGQAGANRFFQVAHIDKAEIAREVGKLAEAAASAGIVVAKTILGATGQAKTVWTPTESRRRALGTTWSVPLGVDRQGKEVGIDVAADKPCRTLLMGSSGSGKTNLLNYVILELAHRYAPEDLQLYLLDFKGGTGLAAFATLPHAAVVGMDDDPEFGLSTLLSIASEMNRRQVLLRQAGPDIADIYAYRALPAKMPVLLLLVDEFQTLFESTGKIGDAAQEVLKDILKRGRNVGVCVVMASQTLRSTKLSAGVLSQFDVRVALKLGRDDFELVMGIGNQGYEMLAVAGDGLLNAQSGAAGANSFFKTPEVDRKALRGIVAELRQRAADAGFEGRAIVRDGSSAEGADVRNHPGWKKSAATVDDESVALTLYLGEPLTIERDHVALRLERSAGGNALLVGKDADAAGVLGGMLCTLARLPASQHPKVTVVTGKSLKRFGALAAALGSDAGVAVHPADGWAEPVGVLASECVARKCSGKDSVWDPKLVVLAGLQDLPRGSKADGEALATLIKEGPSYGIHVFLAASSTVSMMRFLVEHALTEKDARSTFFNWKVLLRDTDGARAIEGTTDKVEALRTGEGLLVLRNDERRATRFRSYTLGSAEACVAAEEWR